jgi:hypothetical protein
VINSLRFEVHDTGELPYREKPPCGGCDDATDAAAKRLPTQPPQ